jgi:ABC-type glucose/galactose transport system permease subunit
MIDSKHTTHRATRVGTVLSLACAVHCMAAPVLLLALPNLGQLLTAELEWVLAIGIAGLTIPAGINAWRAGATWAIAGFVIGFALLLGSFVLGHDHTAGVMGSLLAIGGSLMLASAHWHTQRRLACC